MGGEGFNFWRSKNLPKQTVAPQDTAAKVELWRGENQIVIGIDIGTTLSAVTYAYLYLNGPQTPQRVTRWPGLESQSGDSKIPSIVWYDSNLRARSFAAEARLPDIEYKAETEKWTLVEFFKLHLHPSTMRTDNNISVPPLPGGLTVEQVYADYLGYLFRNTETFFKERMLDGPSIWNEYREGIRFVIAHPNGWDLREQRVLAQAAIRAGLVPTLGDAEERIHFVGEAEASVHYILFNRNDIQTDLKAGMEFLVCDAGGSTVDTTFYAVESVRPRLHLKEKAASACVQAGAIFVNRNAEDHFRNLFGQAHFTQDELNDYIAQGLKSFENDIKKSFGGTLDEKVINFGAPTFTDATFGIRKGRMVLSGMQVQSFFSPCVKQISECIRKQMQGHRPQYLLICGGFGDSPYLKQELRREFKDRGLQVILANESAAKAVSDGAIVWFIKQTVIARATRYNFGIVEMRYGTEVEAQKLGRRLIKKSNGDFIGGYWSGIINKGTIVTDTDEHAISSRRTMKGTRKPTLTKFATNVYAYDAEAPPTFILSSDAYYDFEKEISTGTVLPGMRLVATVSADLSQLCKGLKRQYGSRGRFWQVDFEIVIKFGLTSLEAYLKWEEDGVKRQGPASLIPPAFF